MSEGAPFRWFNQSIKLECVYGGDYRHMLCSSVGGADQVHSMYKIVGGAGRSLKGRNDDDGNIYGCPSYRDDRLNKLGPKIIRHQLWSSPYFAVSIRPLACEEAIVGGLDDSKPTAWLWMP